MATMKMRLYPDWGQRVLRAQPSNGRYGTYVRVVGHEIEAAAIVVFKTFDHRNNQFRTSEFTPPKYVTSFKVRYYRETLRGRVSNTDPGWHLVEWGAHPGGGDTRVLRYKPLTRGLIIVGARHKGG